jgi:isopentenyl diphosphate isomerase/L-lactate dehydrogenase-like FMN-dependent dehydrogenase
MRAELERDMKLMGKTAVSQLSSDNLRFRSWRFKMRVQAWCLGA